MIQPNEAAKIVVCMINAMTVPSEPVRFVSTPITGVPLAKKHEYTAKIDGYRRTLENVIDPTLFEVQGWTNSQYNDMWDTVIRHIRPVMIFSKGWQNSEGCNLEAKLSIELGLKTLNHKLKETKIDIK